MTSLVHFLYLHSFQILCYKEQFCIILEYIQTIHYIYVLTLYFIWLLFFFPLHLSLCIRDTSWKEEFEDTKIFHFKYRSAIKHSKLKQAYRTFFLSKLSSPTRKSREDQVFRQPRSWQLHRESSNVKVHGWVTFYPWHRIVLSELEVIW
jgi:hypothetical protein